MRQKIEWFVFKSNFKDTVKGTSMEEEEKQEGGRKANINYINKNK